MGAHSSRPEHPKAGITRGRWDLSASGPGTPTAVLPRGDETAYSHCGRLGRGKLTSTVAKLKCGYRGGGETRKAPPRLRFAPGDEPGAPLSTPRKGTTTKPLRGAQAA